MPRRRIQCNLHRPPGLPCRPWRHRRPSDQPSSPAHRCVDGSSILHPATACGQAACRHLRLPTAHPPTCVDGAWASCTRRQVAVNPLSPPTLPGCTSVMCVDGAWASCTRRQIAVTGFSPPTLPGCTIRDVCRRRLGILHPAADRVNPLLAASAARLHIRDVCRRRLSILHPAAGRGQPASRRQRCQAAHP